MNDILPLCVQFHYVYTTMIYYLDSYNDLDYAIEYYNIRHFLLVLRDFTVGEDLRDTLPGKLKHIILKVRRS